MLKPNPPLSPVCTQDLLSRISVCLRDREQYIFNQAVSAFWLQYTSLFPILKTWDWAHKAYIKKLLGISESL